MLPTIIALPGRRNSIVNNLDPQSQITQETIETFGIREKQKENTAKGEKNTWPPNKLQQEPIPRQRSKQLEESLATQKEDDGEKREKDNPTRP